MDLFPRVALPVRSRLTTLPTTPQQTMIPMLSPDVAGHNLDLAISQALNCLTSDLLSSLPVDSPSSQSTFVGALLRVDALVQSCQQSLKAETLDLISSFVNLATLLPSGLRQADSESSAVLSQFSGEIADMFGELKLTDDVAASAPLVVSYLEPSCRWLKDNWYNPYPSVEVRSAIARKANAPRKDVDSWFVDARKRIGWNDLRRRRFDNKRANIVDAAKRFLKSETEALSPEEELPSDIENELAAILGQVTSWYEEKFAQSKLARKLDPVVVDMTPELKQMIKEASAARKQQVKAKKARQSQRPYPTPERSPASSIANLSTPHDGSPRPNLKRRVSDSSCDEAPFSKRVCTHSEAQDRGDIAFIGLPSPVSSPREETFSTSSSPSEPAVPVAQSTSPTPAPESNKRKRRLSDSFHYPAAKRPQLRQQAVSDPFPNVSVSGGDWDWLSQSLQDMSNSTSLPPPVSVEAPDPNIPLEIELSNLPAVPALASNELNSSVTESLFTYTTQSYEELPSTLLDGPIDFSVCGFDNIETQVAPQIDEPLAITSDLATYHPYVPEFHAGTIDAPQTLPDVLELASTFSTEPSTYSPALLASIASFDPNSYIPEDHIWTLFATPPSIDNPFSFGISNTVPSQTSSPEHLSTDDLPSLTDLEREAKKKELEELEARVQAIRAQIAKGP